MPTKTKTEKQSPKSPQSSTSPNNAIRAWRERRRQRCLAAVAALNGMTIEAAAKRILDRELDLIAEEMTLPCQLG